MRKVIPPPAACAWCSGEVPEEKVEPGAKHQFCSASCRKSFGIW